MTTISTDSCKRLFVDLETYSGVDLQDCGLYKYVESPDFRVLLVAWAIDDAEVQVIDLEKGEPLTAFLRVLQDARIVKVAHNCAFERACLRKLTGRYQPPEEWEDTMHLAAMNGLPLTLEGVGKALGLPQQKLKEGKQLITFFCKPHEEKTDDEAQLTLTAPQVRRLPSDAPEKWDRFKYYNKVDVEVERTVYRRLAPSTRISDAERAVFYADARINERGVLVDETLARAALSMQNRFEVAAREEMAKRTGLANPNSVPQLREWLCKTSGLRVTALDKEAVAALRAKEIDHNTDRVLELRQQLGKTSTKKYTVMLRAACADHRVRGITQYYGAGRTGRWAGRLVQMQNLPQNHLDRIEDVRQLVRDGDYDTVAMIYDSIPDTLSQLVRTAFVAPEGKTLLVADYSAIEARVIAYLACEQWRLDAFAAGKDIYCQSASQMFHVPVEKHGVNGHLRQKGKIAELACGYGGGVAALKAFGADKMGLTEPEMKEIVDQWRAASPMIPKLWRRVEDAAVRALENPGKTYGVQRKCYDPTRATANENVTGGRGYSTMFNAGGIVCIFRRDKDALRCTLPSGRKLSYWGARIDSGGQIVFKGLGSESKNFVELKTWGGKLVENVVQAFARDCLATAIVRLDAAGYNICFHVHDEIIAEAPADARWEDMAAIMSQPIEWAPGLLLPADGYSTLFYKKE